MCARKEAWSRQGFSSQSSLFAVCLSSEAELLRGAGQESSCHHQDNFLEKPTCLLHLLSLCCLDEEGTAAPRDGRATRQRNPYASTHQGGEPRTAKDTASRERDKCLLITPWKCWQPLVTVADYPPHCRYPHERGPHRKDTKCSFIFM